MPEKKSWIRSKTILFNLVILGGAIYLPGITDNIREILIVVAVTNLGLRVTTTTAVRWRK